MHRKRWTYGAAGLLLSFSLVAAACAEDEVAGGSADLPAASPAGDGVLKIGTLLPETGDLALRGSSQFVGVELAVQEINAAGGFKGEHVVLTRGDSGDSTTYIANQTVENHLTEGVDVIVGAASSDVSFRVIDTITGSGVIQFSPASTSPDLTRYDDKGLFFRTAPSDVLQGKVLADLILEEGHTKPFILARQDPYGEGLLKYTSEPLEEAGATPSNVVYDPYVGDFTAGVDQAVLAEPDAIVLIGYSESEQIIKEMIAKGIGPSDIPLLLVDGNIGSALSTNFTVGELAGVRGTLPSAELTTEFRERMLEVDPGLIDFSYGPESYDAVIITALAAEIAGTDFPPDVAAEINGVTRDGTICTGFGECRDLIAEGEDIDYEGVGGPYNFTEEGEPSEASFAIQKYGIDNQIDPALTVYKFAQLEVDNSAAATGQREG